MATNAVPDELEIEPTEEPFDEEQDRFRHEISYYPSDMTLKDYQDKWNTKQLVLPAFQRAYVWDQIRASKLVESFLLGPAGSWRVPLQGTYHQQASGN